VDDDRLRYSEEFSDPLKLLATAEKMGLEGIVSKRRNACYRSGTVKNSVKVKSKSWRDANRDRWELFQRG
jgi:ATP-dependent DNA ligase